jgi:alcohol sulfotransferase
MNNKSWVARLIHKITRSVFGRHRVTLFRWRRARRDISLLARADVAFVSHAKAGRTWVRVMISRLYQKKYNLPENRIIEHDNFHKVHPPIPVFFFSMGNYVADVRPIIGEDSPFQAKKLIFLARHPADTAVSYYFQLCGRTNPDLLDIKRLPANLSGTPIHEFMINPSYGLPSVIRYMNKWAEALKNHPRCLLLRYEDMRAHPDSELKRVGVFMGENFSDGEYKEAAEFASFNKLKEKERANYFQNSRLQARDPANPESYKVRRGKVGGFRDYFKDGEIAWIEQLVDEELDSVFGYSRQGQVRIPF